MRKFVVSLALVAAVAGCAATLEHPDASIEEVSRVFYRDPAGPSMTLITVVNNRSGGGGHTALMVNASERVIFDPAGSFYADVVPEREDVLYGVSPSVYQAFRSAHARSTYHIVSQTVPLSAQQAQIAYQLVTTNGRVASAFCANSTSSIIGQIPGFEGVKTTFFPIRLQEQIASYPDVVTEKYYEDDSGNLLEGLEQGNAALNAIVGL